MTTPPPPPPAERFAAMLQWLSNSLAARFGWDRVLMPLMPALIARLRNAKWRFVALAARIASGRYQPRRRPATSHHRQPPKNPLPTQFGWLLPLLPGAGGFSQQLDRLLREPEVQALIAQAPEPMGRLLRPLCRMLAVVPPPILARPRRPGTPRPTSPSPPAGKGRGEGSRPAPEKPATPRHPFLKRKPSANWPGRKIAWPD
jgi:hypothetical protein